MSSQAVIADGVVDAGQPGGRRHPSETLAVALGPPDHQPRHRAVEQFVVGDDGDPPVQFTHREVAGHAESDTELLDRQHRIGNLLGEVLHGVARVERDHVHGRPGLDIGHHRAVRAHGVAVGELELVDHRHG